MTHMENIVKRFLVEEGYSLSQAMEYAAMTLSKTTGQVNDIASGIRFSEHQYTPERQKMMAEVLGEALFAWHVLATTLDGLLPEEIEAAYINAYEISRSLLAKQKVTLQDMMDLERHIKPEAIEQVRERDSKFKQRVREDMQRSKY